MAVAAAGLACAPPESEQERAAGGRTAAVDPATGRRVGSRLATPYLRVLGTAQDGGFPHAACECDRCDAAREDPGVARAVASLAVVLPESDRVYLVDATPDVRRQLDALADVRHPPHGKVDRSPVDGVLLTHAHIGHYLGLAFFGFEAVSAPGIPTFCTPRMAEFLRTNGPWGLLVELGNLTLTEVVPGGSVTLGDGVSAQAIAVPHRDEYTDTVAWLFRGPRRAVLYVPDTDRWETWERPIEEWVAEVDVALVDGTFYSPDELPGRRVEQIGHPLITLSMDRLAEYAVPDRPEEARVRFIHLNHSNPALEAGGEAAREIERRGFAVVDDGDEIPL